MDQKNEQTVAGCRSRNPADKMSRSLIWVGAGGRIRTYAGEPEPKMEVGSVVI